MVAEDAAPASPTPSNTSASSGDNEPASARRGEWIEPQDTDTAAVIAERATAAASTNPAGYDQEGNPNYEVLDEGAELVRRRFVHFLLNHKERLPKKYITEKQQEHQEAVEPPLANFSTVTWEADVTNNDNDEEQKPVHWYHPYLYQLHAIASHVLSERGGPQDEDATNPHPNDHTHTPSPHAHLFAPQKPHRQTTTLFVDFSHLHSHDEELAEAIQMECERFDASLRRALRQLLTERHPNITPHIPSYTPADLAASLNNNITSSSTAGTATLPFFAVAFYNLPTQCTVRQLKMEDIGKLTCFSGTVTRTSQVRPELLTASFRCQSCGLSSTPLPQDYYYTTPTLCRNPRCDNANYQTASNTDKWMLQLPGSEFVDWQKARVQENAHEIPPGSMPRTVDVVLRNDMAEGAAARPGDVCLFVGTLVVIPDGHALSRMGETVLSQKDGGDAGTGGRRRRGADEEAGAGVKGLKRLGVRELTYRTCFVARCVLHPNAASAAKASVEQLKHSRRNNKTKNHRAASEASSFLQSQVIDLLLTSSDQDEQGSSRPRHEEEEPLSTTLTSPTTATATSTTSSTNLFTEEELRTVANMRAKPQLYTKLAHSMAPHIFGHPEVKRGILLMLAGGLSKTTDPTGEKMKLRGDINVCIIGDPSTAKSQFLKYVHKFWPSRTVYTSGRASSAAGLTASVQRDADTGEYCIEAGALMLADGGGICCIDEFDKMDIVDQVAIHEAMEQQTISITKAGIQATLNARASILAAANPVRGRYDRTKTLRANVTLTAPILSRFDLFFVVLDECDEIGDYHVASHILDVHRGKVALEDDDDDHDQQEYQSLEDPPHDTDKDSQGHGRPPFTKAQLQLYLRYARTMIRPRITEESRKVFVECYRGLRQGDTMGGSGGRTAYRITVRQLESMIRLSEALARIHLDHIVRPNYVREACRLLRKSIIHVETEDVTFEDDYEEDEQEQEQEGSQEDGHGSSGDEDDDDHHHHDPTSAGATKPRRRSSSTKSEKTSADDIEEDGEQATTVHQDASGDEGTKTSPDDGDDDDDNEKPGKKKRRRIAAEGEDDVQDIDKHREDEVSAPPDTQSKPQKKKSKKKRKKQTTTRVTFEQYESIANAIAMHLRSLEDEGESSQKAESYITWAQAVEWYLEQCQGQIGTGEAAEEEEKRLRRLTNMVIRRLIERDHVLVFMDANPDGEREDRLIAVHPNYVIS